MAYPFYYEMGFTKSEVATVSKIFGVIATVIGVVIGGLIVKRYGIMPSLLGAPRRVASWAESSAAK